MLITKAKKILVLAISAIVLTGCAAPKTKSVEVSNVLVEQEKKKQQSLAFNTYIARIKRLNKISYPIKKAATFICEEDFIEPVIGFNVVTIDSFAAEWHDVAVKEYGLGKSPQIISIIDNSPASIAGLKINDILVKFDGTNIIIHQDFVKANKDLWEKSIADGEVTITVSRDDELLDIKLIPEQSCNYQILYSGDDNINAYADGSTVVINKGMLRFVNDNELAVIVAHEISHNAMKHIEAKIQNATGGLLLDLIIIGTTGVNPNFGLIAANLFSQEFESEADYVAMYILARAGHDLETSLKFWRKLAADSPESIEKHLSSTHPSTPQRFIAIQEAIVEINNKITNNEELVPNFKE